MKKIYFFALLILACSFTEAQDFIRVYNSSGDKIGSGHLVERFSNDSALILQKNNTNDTIAIQDVGYIKTKRGIGHYMLIGAIIGAPVGALIGGLGAASTNEVFDPFTQEKGTFDVGASIIIGFFGGAATGASVGAITGAFKNAAIISINGDIQTWRNVRGQIH